MLASGWMELFGLRCAGGQDRRSHLPFLASTSPSLLPETGVYYGQSYSANPDHSMAFLIPSDLHLKKSKKIMVVWVEGKVVFGCQLHLSRSVTSFISQVRGGMESLLGDSWGCCHGAGCNDHAMREVLKVARGWEEVRSRRQAV